MTAIVAGHALELKAPEGTPIVHATVSPQTAEKWLRTQIVNRSIQRAAMRAYRADMVARRWTYTAAPICFDWNGHLIDGQNRLTALAGITDRHFGLRFAIARGLDPESQMYMDRGARRTAGQQLGLKGIVSGSAVAAGIRLALIWEHGLMFSDRRGTDSPITPAEVIEWAQDHPEAVALAQRFLSRIRAIGLRPSSGLAFVITVGAAMPEELDLFVSEMHTLENLGAGSPTLAYAKRLARTRNDSNLTLSDIDQLGFLIRTWNAWVGGTRRLKLALPSDGWNIDNFPRVEGL